MQPGVLIEPDFRIETLDLASSRATFLPSHRELIQPPSQPPFPHPRWQLLIFQPGLPFTIASHPTIIPPNPAARVFHRGSSHTGGEDGGVTTPWCSLILYCLPYDWKTSPFLFPFGTILIGHIFPPHMTVKPTQSCSWS